MMHVCKVNSAVLYSLYTWILWNPVWGENVLDIHVCQPHTAKVQSHITPQIQIVVCLRDPHELHYGFHHLPAVLVVIWKVSFHILANPSDWIRCCIGKWEDLWIETDLELDHWLGRWGVIWVAVFHWLLVFIQMAWNSTRDVSKEVHRCCLQYKGPSLMFLSTEQYESTIISRQPVSHHWLEYSVDYSID